MRGVCDLEFRILGPVEVCSGTGILRPMQFAVVGAFGHQALWGHLALGLAWAAAFAATGLVIFQLKTRTRRHTA
jgi:hypothetical protein